MYIYPTSVRSVSDDFADHVVRGSANPGTDYTCGYGSRVVSVAAGLVTDADGNPDGSGGRMVHVDHDDGTGADYLHLSALSVSSGDRVAQGQLIGYSGGSGFGDNRYYGSHLHLSFRRRHGAAYTGVGNIDFDALMASSATDGGGAAPIPNSIPRGPGRAFILEEDDMPQPIIARGDKVDTWYALYNRVADANADIEQAPDGSYLSTQSSGTVYFGRRLVGPGERAAIQAYRAQTGYLLPDSNQKEVVVMSQSLFDQINKIAGSDYSR